MADNFKEYMKEDAATAKNFQKVIDEVEEAMSDYLIEIEMEMDEGNSDLRVPFKNLNSVYDELKKACYFVLYGSGLNAAFRSFAFFISIFYSDSTLINTTPAIIYIIGYIIFLFTSMVSIHFFMKLYRIEDYSKII